MALHSSWACPFSKKTPIFPFSPVLVHDSEAISGPSDVIIEYIDEMWKGKSAIFPKNPKDRAKACSLIKFILVKCMPTVMRVCWDRGWETAALQNAYSCLKVLEDELINGKKYFGGDRIGAVDISAVFIALWAEVDAEANAIN